MVLAIAVPIMVQNGITNFVSLLDNIMIGRIGTEQMSGAAIVNQLLFVYNLCIFGGVSGAGIFTAQYFGQKDHEGVRQTFRYKFWLAVALTATAMVLFLGAGDSLINMYLQGDGTTKEIADTLIYGKQYLQIMLLGLPAFMMVQIYASTLRECGETMLPMKAGVAAVLVNLLFNYILIYGKLGFPELGLLGAGISTLFSRIVMVVVFVIIFMRSPRFIRYKVGFFRLGWSRAVFSRLNGLGWPVAFQMGMETASFSLSAIMIGWLGTIALASHQVMLAISQFTFMMYYGMGAAVAVRVSNFNGQDDMVNVRRSAYAGFHLMMALGVVLSFIVFLCRNYLGGWFTDSSEVAAMVTSLIFPFLIYQFGDGLQITFANALRGIADVKLMMVIAFIAYFIISLPVGYFCGFVMGWGVVGVWMAFPFGLTSAGLMLWWRFHYMTKQPALRQ